MESLLAILEQVPVIAALRTSTYAYPAVTTAHLIGVALLFGGIVPLDLRIAGWRSSTLRTDALARVLLPTAIAGLVLALCAGVLLFATDARAYAGSTLFRIKMACVAAGIANALALRWRGWRHRQDRQVAIAGLASIALWLTAIVLGRLIGFF